MFMILHHKSEVLQPSLKSLLFNVKYINWDD